MAFAQKQPTEFKLEVYPLPVVFETPELITSLSEYAFSRQESDAVQSTAGKNNVEVDREASVLFLRIFTAADYFTLNETLMANVPPVYVDIILDPYLLNIVPRSLVPVIAYITPLVPLSWFLGHALKRWLRGVASPTRADQLKKAQ
jgi:hypothetical protein